jgi:hypothetical protein
VRHYEFLVSYHGLNKTIMTYKRNLSQILLWECKIYSSNISRDTAKHKTMWNILESNDINAVLKTYVMILNDLMIIFMSLSLILLALRLLTAHNWDLKKVWFWKQVCFL